MLQPRYWYASIDESGLFDAADSHPLLAAVLVDTAEIGALNRQLREHFEQQLPHISWPLHATYLNVPLYHLLCAEATNLAWPEWRGVTTVLNSSRADLDRLVNDLRWSQSVRYERVHQLDRDLKCRAAKLHRQLERRVQETTAAIRRILEWLAASHADAFAIVASETCDGECVNAPEGRYFAVLDTLVERIQDCLARLAGTHCVYVSALELPVHVPGRGTPKLSAEDVNQAIGRVKTRRQHTSVKVLRGKVCPFDARVDSTFVLADFVANRALATLKPRRDAGLRAVEDSIGNKTNLKTRSGNPAGSHFAAAGAAREYVHACRVSQSAPPWPPGARRWAREQAEAWAML